MRVCTVECISDESNWRPQFPKLDLSFEGGIEEFIVSRVVRQQPELKHLVEFVSQSQVLVIERGGFECQNIRANQVLTNVPTPAVHCSVVSFSST